MEKIRTQWHFRRLEHNDVIYLYLNLEHPHTRELVLSCEKLGFFFSGILPDALPGHDAIVLQYLNNLAIDYSTITPVCPFARQIVDYICSEDNKISN